ncbi:MAG: hypothetical protein ABR591_10825 [Candidatus Velthaea sp.]
MTPYLTVTDAAGRVLLRRLATPAEAAAAAARGPAAPAAPPGLTPPWELSSADGAVTAEISRAGYAAYLASRSRDAAAGDRHAFDAARGLHAVYDAAGRLRELQTAGREGLYVRINFPARG